MHQLGIPKLVFSLLKRLFFATFTIYHWFLFHFTWPIKTEHKARTPWLKWKYSFSEILNKTTKIFCALGPSAYRVPTSSAELSKKLCVCERMNVLTFVCMPADNEDSKPNSSPLWIVTGARFPGISTALSPLHQISMPKPQNFYKSTYTASLNPTSTPEPLYIYKYMCTWKSVCLSAYKCVSGLPFVWTSSPQVNMWYVVVWPREPVIEGNAILDVCTGHKDHSLFSGIWQFLGMDGTHGGLSLNGMGRKQRSSCVAGQSKDCGLRASLFLNWGRAAHFSYQW